MIEIYFVNTKKVSDIVDENITVDNFTVSFQGVNVLYLHDNSRDWLLAGRPLHDDAKKFIAYIYTKHKILSGYDGYKPDGGYAAMQESLRFRKMSHFKNRDPYDILADYFHAVDTLTTSEFMDETTIQELTDFMNNAKIEVDEMEAALIKIKNGIS